jgi:type II secretory pathway pseudopilin PulG
MLIDLLIAVAIIGIAAIATIEIITASARAGKQAQSTQAATSLCRERLEQIRNIPNLTAGTGSNTGDSFLPDLNGISVNAYFTGFYLTESDTYQASDGTPGSLAVAGITGRVDRITQIEWVDDPSAGSAQDFYRVTVTVFWQMGGETRSLSLETIRNAG